MGCLESTKEEIGYGTLEQRSIVPTLLVWSHVSYRVRPLSEPRLRTESGLGLKRDTDVPAM